MMRLTFPIHARIPAPEALVLRGGRWRQIWLPVRYGVLERPGHGPVLIDAGWAQPRGGDSLAFRAYDKTMRAKINAAANPQRWDPEQIILSHLHADHVGLLRDVSADVPLHVDQHAWESARRGGWKRLRQGVFAELLPERPVLDLAAAPQVQAPLGLGTAQDVLGDGSVLAMPLPGHAEGHYGFVFPQFATPVLYAADTQWLLAALAPERAPRGVMTRIYSDPKAVPDSIARVRAFAEAGGRVVLNHDPGPVDPFEA